METPPISNDDKINFNVSETFNIKVNEKNIKLQISYNEKSIFFEAEEEEDIFPKKEFSLLASLEELIKINKYFSQFDTLREVFHSIKIIILNKNISIIKEDKKIKLKIKNPLTNKEFFINLLLKKKELKSEMENFIPYISSLNNKINNLENQISQMKIEFSNTIKALEQKYQDEINKCEENILKKIEERFPKNEFFQNSNIVQLNEKDLILNWFDKRPKSIDLLLNANIDDNFYKSFFDNCGNKANTMIFIKTTDNVRFGGFTSVIWPTNGKAKDKESFIFSLNKRKKYKIIYEDNAIEVSNGSIISFGCGNDLYLYNNLKKGGGTCKSAYDIPGTYDLNEGKNRFKLLSCEIYQIVF